MTMQPMLQSPHTQILATETAYTKLSDVELVLACQRKDAMALNVLLKRHNRLIHAHLYRLAPDWSNCREDLAQEVSIRIWKSIKTLKNPHAFKAWVNQLVTHLFYDELRKRTPLSIVSLDEPFTTSADDEQKNTRDVADLSSQPDECCELQELIDCINQAIDTLPQQFRTVFVLRGFYGLPYTEIAALTKSQIGTVKSRLNRARARVQDLIEPLQCA